MNKDIRTIENIIFYLKFTLDKKESKLNKLLNKFRTKKINIKIEKLENEIITLKYIKEFYILSNTEKSKQGAVKEESIAKEDGITDDTIALQNNINNNSKIPTCKSKIKEIINRLGCVSYECLKQQTAVSVSFVLDEDLFLLTISNMIKDNSINCDNLNDITKAVFMSDKQFKINEKNRLEEHARFTPVHSKTNLYNECKRMILEYVSSVNIIKYINLKQHIKIITQADIDDNTFSIIFKQIIQEMIEDNFIYCENFTFKDTDIIRSVEQNQISKDSIKSTTLEVLNKTKFLRTKELVKSSTEIENEKHTLVQEEQELLEYLYTHGEQSQQDIKRHFESLTDTSLNNRDFDFDIITEALKSLHEQNYITIANRINSNYKINRDYVNTLVFQNKLQLNINIKLI